MLEAFYSHLEEKSANDSELKLLRAQWDFDNLLLENALQHVGSVFNHYSRHDSSHSRKILVNIAKLLGDKLQLLSATDTWLIMEGAFLHDTGMLASREDILETKEKADFVSFVRSIARDKLHELNCLAQQYNPDDPLWCFKKAENPVAAVEQWYQLLATWFRGRHGVRSGDTVLHPENKGIHSPRSSLIPHRLLRCLSKICRMHTAPFEHIKMELQQFEDGMSNELCHPRFVACLLRMGDLLDMDNGRFCPVMAALYGKGPRSKAAHLDKHESIVHLRCSEQFIEAHAECETDEGYLATSDWFAMLEKEAEKQLKTWDEIVPSPGFMSIPIVKVELRHKDTDFLLHGGRLPKLSLSENEVFEILQGADIYAHKWQSLRELLQNAEDATLVRLWVCHKKEILEKGNSPLSGFFLDLLEKNPVVIRLCKALDESNNVILSVAIEDKGCGISREAFEKMLLVGSGKDDTLQNIIDDMPEWLKPSGAFGLGLQSAFFMGAQKLEFFTRSLLDNSAAHITIPSQLGMGGFAKYKSDSYKPGADYGSTLSFSLVYKDDFADIVRENFGSGYDYSPRTPYYIVPDPFKEKDDFLHDPVLQAIDFEIKQFSENCFCKIVIDRDGKEEAVYKEQRNYENIWFDCENNILLSRLPENMNGIVCFNGGVFALFRGQELSYLSEVNWNCEIDVRYGNAKDALSISRNAAKVEFEKDVVNAVYRSIFNYICCNYEKMNELQKNYVALNLPEVERHSGKTFPDTISREGFEKVVISDNGNSLCDVLNEAEDFIIYSCRNYSSDIVYNIIKKSQYKHIKIYHTFNLESLNITLSFLIKKCFYVKNVTCEDNILLVSKNKHKYYCDNEYLCVKIGALINRKIIHRYVLPRISMPCSDSFRDLSVTIPKFGVKSLFDTIECDNRMILPYELISTDTQNKIKREDIEAYTDWVYKNSAFDTKPDKECIRKKYYELIEYIEITVMNNSDIWLDALDSEPLCSSGGLVSTPTLSTSSATASSTPAVDAL